MALDTGNTITDEVVGGHSIGAICDCARTLQAIYKKTCSFERIIDATNDTPSMIDRYTMHYSLVSNE